MDSRTVYLTTFSIIFMVTGLCVVFSMLVLHDNKSKDASSSNVFSTRLIALTYSAGATSMTAAIVCNIMLHYVLRRELVVLFVLLVILMLTLKASVTTIAFAEFSQMQKDTESRMLFDLQNYKTHPVSKQTWDEFQTFNKCCGIFGPNDWIQQFGELPLSCCRPVAVNCTLHTSTLNTRPCRDVTHKKLYGTLGRIAVTGVIYLLLESVGVVLCVFVLVMGSLCPPYKHCWEDEEDGSQAAVT